MEKRAFQIPLHRPFVLEKLHLQNRHIEIWRKDKQMAEYAPFPGLHHCLENYQNYLLSELDFFKAKRWEAKDIGFNGLIIAGQVELDGLEDFRVIKVKCARQSLEKDIQYFRFLAKRLSQTQFRIDANELWSKGEFKQFAANVDLERIDYFEGPTSDCLGLAKDYPIAFDELALRYASKKELLKNARAIIVKPHLYDDIAHVISFIEWGNRHQIPVVLSSLFNSSVGTQNLLRLACLCQQETTHGAFPFFYLNGDTVANPLVAKGDSFSHKEVAKQLEIKQ